MSEYREPIDASSLRIRLDETYEYRKDIINDCRERWQTSNKSKAVMRSADAFVDVLDELEQLLEDPALSLELKRELAERLESRHFELRYDFDVGLDLKRND